MRKKKKKILWKQYLYKAKVTKVVDGDTFDVLIDLGFKVHLHHRIRLVNVDTPEIRGKERKKGLKVKEYVKNLILNKDVLIQTYKLGKYGRYVCEIYLGSNRRRPLSKHLLRKKMAKKFMVIK